MPPPRPGMRMPAPPTRPEPRLPDGPQLRPDQPNRKWTAAFAGLAIVLGILAAYDLLSGGGALTAAPIASHTVSPGASPSASPKPTVPARSSQAPSAKRSSSRRSATGSASRSGGSSVKVRELSAVSAAAFGPDGTSDGDNANKASRVLVGNGVNAWSSLWYRTPDFGKLQAGTGLLVDMGSVVSVSRVRVVLGDSKGADVQLRLGDSAGDPSDLSTAASASGVGGTVHLSPSSPVRARYVLIWFTRLPPDHAGTYQVLVYSITVAGHS